MTAESNVDFAAAKTSARATDPPDSPTGFGSPFGNVEDALYAPIGVLIISPLCFGCTPCATDYEIRIGDLLKQLLDIIDQYCEEIDCKQLHAKFDEHHIAVLLA